MIKELCILVIIVLIGQFNGESISPENKDLLSQPNAKRETYISEFKGGYFEGGSKFGKRHMVEQNKKNPRREVYISEFKGGYFAGGSKFGKRHMLDQNSKNVKRDDYIAQIKGGYFEKGSQVSGRCPGCYYEDDE